MAQQASMCRPPVLSTKTECFAAIAVDDERAGECRCLPGIAWAWPTREPPLCYDCTMCAHVAHPIPCWTATERRAGVVTAAGAHRNVPLGGGEHPARSAQPRALDARRVRRARRARLRHARAVVCAATARIRTCPPLPHPLSIHSLATSLCRPPRVHSRTPSVRKRRLDGKCRARTPFVATHSTDDRRGSVAHEPWAAAGGGCGGGQRMRFGV